MNRRLASLPKSPLNSRAFLRRTLLRGPAALALPLLVLNQLAQAAPNTEYDVVNGKTDLTAAATYSTGGTTGTGVGGTTPAPGAPTVTSDVTFDSGVAYSPTAFTLNSSQTFGSLNDLSTTTLTIANTSTTGTGDTLTLGGSGDPGSSVPGATAGDLLFVASGGNLSINSGAAGTATALGLVLGQSGTFDNVGTLGIGAVISDGGNIYSLTKTGAGTLSFNAANTFSGGLFINAGTVSTGNAAGLGAGTVTLGAVGSATGVTLQLSNVTVNNAFTINAGGARTIYQGSNVSTVAGLTTFVTGSTLNFGPNGSASINMTGGTAGTGNLVLGYFGAGRAGEAVNITGTAVNQVGTITDAFNNTSIAGSLAGVGNVNISANIGSNVTNVIVNSPGGLMTLSGTNSFQAGTVTQGTLDYQVAAALPSSGTTTVASAGSLILGVGGTTGFTSANVDSLFANTLSGVSLSAGSGIGLDTTPGNFTYATNQTTGRPFTKLGTNSLILTGADNFYDGIVVSAGTLQLGNGTAGSDGSLGLTPAIVNNATVAFNTNSAQSYAGIIGGTGALTKAGAGTLTLSGANFYSGNTTVSAGTLNLSNAQALQNSALQSGGTGLVFDQSVASHAFAIGGLNGGTTLALADNGGNAVALTLSPISATSVYNSALTGGGSLTVAGPGTQTLGGANTYTGGTTVSLGTLKLDFTQTGAPASNILYNGSATPGTLTMGGIGIATNASGIPGANLTVLGKASATSTQSFGGLTINPGVSNITITPGTSGNVQLSFAGALTHNAGGVVNFTDTQSATNFINLGTTANDATGIIGGYATVNGTAYASVNTSGQVVPYTYTTTVGTAGAIADSGAATAETNVELTGAAGTATLSGTSNGATNINTLTNAGTGAQVVTIGVGNTLRLGVNGGILENATTNQALTIGTLNVGTLTAGGNAAGTAGEISIVGRSTGIITINSVIANNNASTGAANSTGGGAVTLTVGSSQTGTTRNVIIAGANTYSGGTFLNGSEVEALTTTSFGTGQVTVLPGALAYLNAAGTYANTFNISGAGANESGFNASIRFVNNSATTISGNINLLGDSSIISNSGDSITGNLSGTGNFNVFGNTSTLILGSTTAGTSTTDTITGNLSINGFAPGVPTNANGVTIKLGGTAVLPNGTTSGNIVINGGNVAAGTNSTLDVNGFSASTNGLISAGANVASSVITNSGAAATLTIGDNNANASFGGTITNGTNALSIIKAGTGTQVFAGADTYTGGTTVTAGTLLAGNVAAFGAVTGTLNVSGGTLDIGAFSPTVGAVTLSSGTIQSTGSTTATLTGSSYGVQSGTVSAILGGTGALTKTTAGTVTLFGADTYTGLTTVSAGTLTAASNLALGSATAATAGLSLTPAMGATATVNFTSAIPAIASLASSGAGTSKVVLGNTTTPAATTLTVGGNNASMTFNGVISDLSGTNVVAVGGLTTVGTGTLTLTGANTYTGATTVGTSAATSSTLLVNGSIGSTTTPAGAVTVNNGGTLGGGGMLTVASVTATGILSPGTTAGATTGALTLNTTGGVTINGTLVIGINGTTGTALSTTGMGALTLGGASTLTVNGTAGAGENVAGDYDIANYSALASGSTFATTNIPSGYMVNYAGTSFNMSGGDIELDPIPVPEPSTVWAGVLMLAGAGWYYRHQRRPVQS